jgi:hypothetical protein
MASDNGNGAPCSLDERLTAFVLSMARVVSRGHRALPRETLFAVGLCLGLQMGVDAPAAASRYAEAIRKALRVRDEGFGRRLAEALGLLAEAGGSEPPCGSEG